MKFEHLVEINDLSNPMIEVITQREQLWRGLVLRAESPKMFVSYIDQVAITDRTEVSMTREIQYGNLSSPIMCIWSTMPMYTTKYQRKMKFHLQRCG